jgi:putative ABC transport system permease protein
MEFFTMTLPEAPMPDLHSWLHTVGLSHEAARGLAQALVVSALALAVAWLGRMRQVHLGRETASALLRGLLQMTAVGLVLVWLLKGPPWWSLPTLAAMCAVAARMAQQRSKSVPHSYWLCLRAIATGSAVVIAAMTLAGVIGFRSMALVPLGSMIIANSMNTCAQVLERFASDLKLNAGRVEAALTLGASPAQAALPYARNAANAALIPSLNSLRSLGIVWIPGFAAGMLLTGSDPVYTAIYQFMVIAMIYAASGLTALMAAHGYEHSAFTSERLTVLR